MNHNVLVSIGLPVYNGQRHVSSAIEAILGQTLGDLELTIADNGSTDATQRICLAYAELDRRVRYLRRDENIGAARNFNAVFEWSTGKYFKWAACDDALAPTYLQKCVGLLESDESLVAAQSLTGRIDARGRRYHDGRSSVGLDAARASVRLGRLLRAESFPEFWGVMRCDVVRRTSLIRSFVGADRSFFAEMILNGPVGYVQEHLFHRRDNVGEQCAGRDRYRACLRWLDPTKHTPALIGGIVKALHYTGRIVGAPPSTMQKACCLVHLGQWVAGKAARGVMQSAMHLMGAESFGREIEPIEMGAVAHAPLA